MGGNALNIDAAVNACIDGHADSIVRIFGRRLACQPLLHGQQPMHLAAAAGNLAAIRQLFELGACLDAPGADISGNVPLHLAVLAKQHDALALLLRLGADVDALNGVKTAPLQDAARLNDIAAGRLLLAAGANPTLQNGYGNTVLHRVCYFGHQSWMAWLSQAVPPMQWTALVGLQNMASLNAADVASSHERQAMVAFLAARGLQPSRPRSELRGMRYSERRQWLEILTPAQGRPPAQNSPAARMHPA